MEINACRLCLANEDLALLFGKLSPAQFTRNQVFLTTGVVILPSDSLPQVACKTCIEIIKSAIHLRNTSIETQNKLQLMYPKTNFTNKPDTYENLLFEINNFTTDDEELNKFLKKINDKVSKTINSFTDDSQLDNISHVDNEFIRNDHLNTDSDLDNKSENSQADNNDYQTDFDHNYYQKSDNLQDGITKYAKRELKINNTKNKLKMVSKKVLISSRRDNKLIKKLNLISRLDKTRFKSNPAMLPARKFKQLFQSFKNIQAQNSTKTHKKGPKPSKNSIEDTTKIKHTRIIQSNKKISQCDNKISHPDNKSDQSDNSNSPDNNVDDFHSFMETEDWDENQLKEIEVQKHIDKKRQEKFMSLAVSPYPINGRLQCKVCLHSLTRHGFVSHAKRHFPPEFACETCGKMFYGNSHLQYHRQRMHGQEKPLACPVCDYRAVWKQDMTGHMRIHTGERPYVCDVCDASFRVRPDIVQHMRTHFGVKNVQCPRCPHKWFRCLSDVAKHNRRIHHDFTYFCHLCPKTYHGYSGRSSVRKHLSKVHGIPRAEQPLKLKYTKIPKPDQFQHGIIDFIK